MKFLTNLIFEPKGRHDPALVYSIKDTVMSADGSRVYFALQDVPAGTVLTDTDFWKLQIDLSTTKADMEAATGAANTATNAANAAADKANAAPTVSFFIDANGNATVDGKVLAVDENGDATI